MSRIAVTRVALALLGFVLCSCRPGGPLWCGPGQNSDAAWGIDPSRSSRGLPPTWLYGVMGVMRQSLVPCVVGPGSDLLESYP